VAHYLLKQGYSVDEGTGRIVVQELYHVDGITGWTGSNSSSAVTAQIPVNRGDPHPDPAYAAAKCKNKVILRKLSPTDAIVLLLYDSYDRWGGAPRGGSESETGQLTIQLPVYTRFAANTAIWVRAEQPVTHERAVISRYAERYTSGDENVILDAIAANQGKRYAFGGRPFLLSRGRVSKANTGQIRVVYFFRSLAPVQAFPAGTFPGQDLAIPALGYLDEYTPPASQTSPSIGVKPGTGYPAGDPLPAF